mmetsp:Transcript_22617/g.53665  ORF Transcript_22617/g.53665 Transcript_22617/m.53665 type:complete len:88 (+) Transcript_22617:304-567(+)
MYCLSGNEKKATHCGNFFGIILFVLFLHPLSTSVEVEALQTLLRILPANFYVFDDDFQFRVEFILRQANRVTCILYPSRNGPANVVY